MKKEDKSFICSKCNKGFTEDKYLQQHLKRKKPCNEKFNCIKCGKDFINSSSLKKHESRVNPCVPEEIPVITDGNIENRCHICNKTYANLYSLQRHQKTVCNVANNPQVMTRLIDTITSLQQQVSVLQQTQNPSTINNTLNITNNIQQNMYLNVTICCFGDEDLSTLNPNEVMNLLKNHEKDFIPRMIEHIHANPDRPEYHNVFYDPKRNKAVVFVPISENEKSWQTRELREVSADMTQKIKEHVMPGNGPYFDIAGRSRDSDTGNAIIRIARHTNWNTPEVLEQTQEVLTKVTKNKSFVELAGIE